jgi:hypothetical protein
MVGFGAVVLLQAERSSIITASMRHSFFFIGLPFL